MTIIDKIRNLLGYEKKSSRALQAELTRLSTTLGITADQELTADLQAYRRTLWTYIAISTIANDIAGLDLKFYRGEGDNIKQIRSHPLIRLFELINPESNPYDFWKAAVIYYLSTGAFIAGVEKNNANRPGELWPLRPDRVKFIPDAEQYIKGIEYTVSTGTKVFYAKDEILWIRNFNPENEYHGLSAIEPLHLSLTVDIHARQYNKNFFINGAQPGFQLSTDGQLTQEQRQRILESWKASYQGSSQAHQPAVFEGGLKPITTGMTIRDMEFLNQLKMNREEVIAAFGVPPAVVGLFEYANYANSQVQQKLYWRKAIIPILRAFESQLNATFIPRYDSDLWCAFDLSQVEALQEDQKEKADWTSRLVQSGIITPNEARTKFWDLPEIDNGDELKPLTRPAGTFGLSYKPKASKESIRTLRWREKDARIRINEDGFRRLMEDYFDDQGKRVLGRVKKIKTIGFDSCRFRVKVNENDLEQIFDNLEEMESLREKAKAKFIEIIQTAGDEAVQEVAGGKQVGFEGVFNVDDEEVQQWIENKIFKFAQAVTMTTEEKLRRILQEASKEGYTIDQIADKVAEAFERFKDFRSVRIARTEVNSSFNGATQFGYEQAGVEKKEWLSARDASVRPEHEDADGQVKAVRQPFIIAGEELMHPGDLGGSPANVINCRCTLIPVLEEG